MLLPTLDLSTREISDASHGRSTPASPRAPSVGVVRFQACRLPTHNASRMHCEALRAYTDCRLLLAAAAEQFRRETCAHHGACVYAVQVLSSVDLTGLFRDSAGHYRALESVGTVGQVEASVTDEVLGPLPKAFVQLSPCSSGGSAWQRHPRPGSGDVAAPSRLLGCSGAWQPRAPVRT